MNKQQMKITQDIILALEKGVKPWVKPWNSKMAVSMPVNLCTQKAYSGINHVALQMTRYQLGYDANTWLTFNQACKLGGSIRKGETGVSCLFYGRHTDPKTQDDTPDSPARSPFFVRSYTVFNIEQTQNLDGPVPSSTQAFTIPSIDTLLSACEAKVVYGSPQACYDGGMDVIRMPHHDAFKTEADFCATLLHELVHWTGHSSRLARRDRATRFGDDAYAFEALVAELGSAFLCADTGIQGEWQHDSYLDAWLSMLKQEPRALFQAASMAAKAHQYLMNSVDAHNAMSLDVKKRA